SGRHPGSDSEAVVFEQRSDDRADRYRDAADAAYRAGAGNHRDRSEPAVYRHAKQPRDWRTAAAHRTRTPHAWSGWAASAAFAAHVAGAAGHVSGTRIRRHAAAA